MRARDAGMDVVYEGIRLTPARIARTAVDEGVHVVGLSILSGSHAELIPSVLAELREAGADMPVVVGGIIPAADEAALLEAGVARVYTPKDFEVSRIMGDIVDLVASATAWWPPRSRRTPPQSWGAGCVSGDLLGRARGAERDREPRRPRRDQSALLARGLARRARRRGARRTSSA